MQCWRPMDSLLNGVPLASDPSGRLSVVQLLSTKVTQSCRRAEDCDNTLMKSRSDSGADKFAPLLHVYDMDVANGTDDATSGVPGSTRRDMGPPAALQARAKAADEATWSEAKGWVSEPSGVTAPSPWGPAAAQ